MFQIWLILLYTLWLHADEALLIQDKPIIADSNGYVYFVKQQKGLDHPDAILRSDHLPRLKRSHIGMHTGPYWTRFTLQNIGKNKHDLIIAASHSGANYIDVYVYNTDTLEATYLLGDMRSQSKRDLLSRQSVFALSIPSGESRTIVTKFDNPGLYRLDYEITDANVFFRLDRKIDSTFAFITALMLIILAHSIMLYRYYRQIAYLIIGFEVTALTLYITAVYGYLYALDIGIPLGFITLMAWIGVDLSVVARTLFPVFFFNMKKNFSKIRLLMITVSASFLFIAFYKATGAFADSTLLDGMDLFMVVPYFLLQILMLGVAFYMWHRKAPGASYYLMAQSFMATLSIVYMLNILEIIPIQWYSQYLLNLALIADALMMMSLQYWRSRQIYQEHIRQKQMLMDQSRFYSIGQAIGHVTHQWKTPLSQASSIVAALEALSVMDRGRILDHIDKNLPILKLALKQMNGALDTINHSLKTVPSKTEISPRDVIENGVLPMLASKQNLKKVTVDLDIDHDLRIECFEHVLLNVMMILIDNSMDEFSGGESTCRNTISISAKRSSMGMVEIIYCDNAGGIKIEPIDSVFDYFVSSKRDKAGHGIGLALVRLLVTEQLNGSITVNNTMDGCCFSIRFP